MRQFSPEDSLLLPLQAQRSIWDQLTHWLKIRGGGVPVAETSAEPQAGQRTGTEISLQLKICGSTVFIFLLTCIRLFQIKIFKNLFFLDGIYSAAKSELECPHPPSALKGFLRGFSCNAPGMAQGSPTHPWSFSDHWGSPRGEDPLAKGAGALRHTFTEPAQAQKHPDILWQLKITLWSSSAISSLK